MTRARAAVLLAAVFLAGSASGALGTAAWLRHRGGPRALPSARAEQVMLRRLARRLDLDPGQRAILQRIAAENGARIDEIRLHAMERVREILDGAYDQLEPTLRPGQRETLAHMRQEARARFRRPGGPE